MIKQLTEHDKAFINTVKEVFNEVDADIEYLPDNKKLGWSVKNNANKNSFKPMMIEAFIQDLTHGTQTYQYHLYTYFLSKNDKLLDKLLGKSSSLVSHQLKLDFLNLFDVEVGLYEQMLSFAQEQKDVTFMLTLLNRGARYNLDPLNRYTLLEQVLFNYEWLQLDKRGIELEVLEQSFISHFKHSQIKISDSQLIQFYLKYFSNTNVEAVYEAFNIEKEKVCEKVEHNAYSQISLNRNTLSMIGVAYKEISEINEELVNQNCKFPQFFPISLTEKCINVLVKTSEQDPYCAEKVIRLFEELVKQKYDGIIDKRRSFKHLIKLISSIDELVHLEHTLENKPQHKANSLKI